MESNPPCPRNSTFCLFLCISGLVCSSRRNTKDDGIRVQKLVWARARECPGTCFEWVCAQLLPKSRDLPNHEKTHPVVFTTSTVLLGCLRGAPGGSFVGPLRAEIMTFSKKESKAVRARLFSLVPILARKCPFSIPGVFRFCPKNGKCGEKRGQKRECIKRHHQFLSRSAIGA